MISVSPRRMVSPFYILLILFSGVIFFNIFFFHRSYDAAKSHGRVQSHADSVDHPEYVDTLMSEMRAAKEHELLELLQKDISEKNTNSIKENLRKEIIENFYDVFKQELFTNIQTQYTTKYFEDKKLSLELFNNLKSEYANKHGKDIQEAAILEAMKSLDLDNTPPDFSKKVTEKLHQKFDKSVYYKSIITNLLVKHGPTDIEALTDAERGKDIAGKYVRDVQEPAISKEYLLKDHVNIGKEKFKKLQDKHDAFVEAIKRLDDPPTDFVNGDGIVISGGGIYFGSALVAVGQIRETGSKLPIEIIMNTMSEYNEQICEELLPNKFNARCIVIEREIGAELLDSLKIKKFQIKIFGLLFSSFNNIIALDADNMPIKNVDELITSEPFLSTKFVLWPDIWHKAVSPQYYDLARFKVGNIPVRRFGIANDWDWSSYAAKDVDKDVNYHDLEGLPSMISIETGQMVFSKRFHFKSFLLSVYYNLYGPQFYYPLFFQGVPGDGDRETVVPALHLLQEPYHIVQHDSWLGGYKHGELQDGDFQETTIVQYDPAQTVEFFEVWEKWLKEEKKLDPRLWPYQSNHFSHNLLDEFKKSHTTTTLQEIKDPNTGEVTTKEVTGKFKFPDVFFLHIHKPKINPIENTKTGSFGIYERRNLGLQGVYDDYGKTDWELKLHSIAKYIACDGITSEAFWKNIAQVEQKKVCDTVSKYVEFLKKDTKDPDAANLSFAK